MSMVPTAEDRAYERGWNARGKEVESLEAELVSARAEIDRCHARLEIDHHFVMADGEGLERRETPMEERASRPDAVSARDATIKLLDKRIARFEADAEPPPSMDMFGDNEWRFSK